jgi:hypothetical protein
VNAPKNWTRVNIAAYMPVATGMDGAIGKKMPKKLQICKMNAELVLWF